MSADINREMRWSVLSSVLLIAAGVVAIVGPRIPGIAVTLLLGWLLVLGGVAHAVYPWNAPHERGSWWGMLLGILYVATGGTALLNPAADLELLTLAAAIYLSVEAILELTLSYFLRRLPGSGWLLLDGVITAVLAVLLSQTWPTNSAWLIGTFVGISMISSGVARLVLPLAPPFSDRDDRHHPAQRDCLLSRTSGRR